jgi:hypothetical protein
MTIEALVRQLEKYYQVVKPITNEVVKASRIYQGLPYQTFILIYLARSVLKNWALI